jgi:hypothetical protein
MRKTSLLLSLLGLLAVVSFSTTSAHAQATRTWVSGVGDDANPCSRTAPCKTFAGAISKTATGGEINCLDPGGFGALTITKSISVICAVEAGVLTSAGNGINIAAGAVEVLLEGLDIEGLGTANNGVSITGGAKVTIRKSSIRNFVGNGVNVVGTAGARALIEDTIILSNAGGVNVAGAGGAANAAILIRTTVDNNATFATSVTAPSVLILNGSTLGGSASAITNNGGATVTSFGNNSITGTGLPTTTPGLK